MQQTTEKKQNLTGQQNEEKQRVQIQYQVLRPKNNSTAKHKKINKKKAQGTQTAQRALTKTT